MKHLLLKLSLIACVAIISCAPECLSAQTLAYTTTGTETDLGSYGLSGIEFTLNMNINVTSVGFTALSLGGGDAPQVTVWQVGAGGALTQLYTTGDILGSVTSAPANESAGSPSFIALPSALALSSGDTYLVTAPAYWAATYDSSGVTTAGGGVFSSTSFLTTGPGGWNNWSNSSYLGATPNISSLSLASGADTPAVATFEFNVAAETEVPEPSTYAMLGAGLALLATVLRRSRSKFRS